MSPQDIIQQKRTDAALETAQATTQRQSLEAIAGSSRLIAGTIAREADTSRQHVQPVEVKNDTLAQREDIQAVVSSILALKEVNSGEFSTLSNAITQALQYVAAKNDDTSTQTAATIRQMSDSLSEDLASIEASQKSGTEAVVVALKGVIQALDKPDKDIPAPIVNVEPAQVTVQERPIDFTPVIKAIDAMKPGESSEDIQLQEYRASDIKDSGGMQYIGFVHPSGRWYIIENDVKKNKMRYLFGQRAYATHFKNAASYEYKVMNEAVNATV